MSGWSTKTFQLIAEIGKEHKDKPYDSLIIKRKQEFFDIADEIKAINGYDINIKKQANKYFKDMKELYDNVPDKKDDCFYVFLYTDLLKKICESPDDFHRCMSICVIVPQICKAIKFYERK